MSQVKSENINVDDLLEQVAIATAEGEFKKALDVIPHIMETGDDMQKQVASSYKMQLEMLVEQERGDAIPAQPASETLCKVDDVFIDELLEESSLEESISLDSLDSDELCQPETDNVKAISLVVDSSAKDARNNSSSTKDEIEILINNVDAKNETELEGHNKKQDISVISDIHCEESPLKEFSPILVETSKQNVVKNDIEMTLEQVVLLLKDHEYEMVEILLKMVVEKGTAEQKFKAEMYQSYVDEALASKNKSEMCDLNTGDFKESQELNIREKSGLITPSSQSNQGYDVGSGLDSATSFSTSTQMVTNDVVSFTSQTAKDVSPYRTEVSENENVQQLVLPSQVLSLTSLENSEGLAVADTQERTQDKESVNLRQGFFVGSLGLMIDFAEGSELIEMPESYRVPHAPLWLTGLTNVHGIVLPIFNLAQHFGVQITTEHKQKKDMLLILQHKEKAFGVTINGLPRRLLWKDYQKVDMNTSPVAIRDHLNSACLIDEQLWFDLNSESLGEYIEKSF